MNRRKGYRKKYRVYSTVLTLVGIGSVDLQSLQITSGRNFNLETIRVFTDDYRVNILLSFQDTTKNENWQDKPFAISGVTIDQGIIPFERFIKNQTELTIQVDNQDVATHFVQVTLIGFEWEKMPGSN